MKNILRILSILACTLYSCEEPTFDNAIAGTVSVPLQELAKTELTGSSFGPTDYFIKPNKIELVHDSILLVTERGKGKAVHFLNIRTQEVFQTYGTIGEGPGEMDAIVLTMHSDPKNNTIDLMEPARKRLATYSIDSMLSGSTTYFPTFTVSPPEIGSPIGMTKIDTENAIIDASFPCARLLKWNATIDEVECSPEIIPIPDEIESAMRGSVAYEVMVVRPDRSLIATASYRFNRIDIYDMNLAHQLAITGKQYHNPFDHCQIVEGRTMCDRNKMEKFASAAIYASQDYLYVSRLEPLTRNPKDIFDNRVVLLVFDWEGNSIARLALDRFIYSFTVDEKNNRLYAVDEQEVNQMIIEYILPDFEA